MRLPTYADLSKEQDRVYLEAPLKGAILISGPPGSGKTVMAFYRADTIARQGHQPTIVMFNKALERYTQSVPDGLKHLDEGRTATFFQWLSGWWRSLFHGQWMPQVARYQPNWLEMQQRLLSDDGRLRQAVRSVGHLLLDEGQDFAPGFYRLMSCLLMAADGQPISISVFADENQRLSQDRNSTLKEIEQALLLAPASHYRLTRNYRNTKQVAEAAASFFAGLPGGIPKLPERIGPKARVVRTKDIDASVTVVAKFIVANDDLEVAVFLPNTTLRKKYYNKLAHRLKREAPSVKVQVFDGEASALAFDKGGTVTVLCSQSSKGLEFDAVFVPDLQQYMCDAANEQGTKMMLYVVSSRARQYLSFIYSADDRHSVPALKYLLSHSDSVEWVDA